MYEKIKARFLEDIKDHQMTIINDDGVNRHIRFSRENSGAYYFDIITFAGNLLITGDMGSYLFSRTTDMFEFFVNPNNPSDDPLYINPCYWGGKLQSIDRNGYEQFSYQLFQTRVEETFEEWKQWKTEISEETLQNIWEQIENEVLSKTDSEYQAYSTLYDFTYYDLENNELYNDIFIDTWEWELKEYTYHYIWNCFAIVWGIKKYEETKTKV